MEDPQSDPLIEEAKDELAILIEANPGLGFFLEHVQATRDAARTEADRLRSALTFFVALYEEGGNGEGWTLTEAYDRARVALRT